MIKDLTSYRNKWVPKYYLTTDDIIFDINSKNIDDCGIQVVDVTKAGDELGKDACEKACGIVIEFENKDPYYFPLQYLISDGDVAKATGFVLKHPTEFVGNGFYMGEFLRPIDLELVDMIKAGKTWEQIFKSLPAWLTTANGTENISIAYFIKGVLKTYDDPDNIPSNVELGKLVSVNFYYKDASSALKKKSLNTYDGDFIKTVIRKQIALASIEYINSKLNKQLGEELTDGSKTTIQNTITGGGQTSNVAPSTYSEDSASSRFADDVVITHWDGIAGVDTWSNYTASAEAAETGD